MAVIRENSFDGPDETAVTEANSGDHGDAFNTVDPSGVTYDADGAYEGTASLRLDEPAASNGVAWDGLSLSDCATRLYINRGVAESGNVWWNGATGTASLSAGGQIATSGLTLVDALPADTWCRVEFTRSGTTGTLSVWSTDPESSGVPDDTESGTVDASTITQWWLEHEGDAIWIDRWALGDTGEEIGAIDPSHVLRTQSCDGEPGAEITAAESGDHGTAWDAVDDGVTYSATAYTGRASIRLGSGWTSGTGVAWQSLSLTDCAIRGYLRRDATAESGNVWWADGAGACQLGTSGALDWSGVGLSLGAGAVPADTWVRVEATRTGDQGTLSVWSTDPQSTGSPDATTSGTITEATVTQWWWERYGDGGVHWDELALLADGEEIGPVELPEVEVVHIGWGLPLTGVS